MRSRPQTARTGGIEQQTHGIASAPHGVSGVHTQAGPVAELGTAAGAGLSVHLVGGAAEMEACSVDQCRGVRHVQLMGRCFGDQVMQW